MRSILDCSLALLAVLVAVLAACSPYHHQAQPKENEDEYEVYRASLRRYHPTFLRSSGGALWVDAEIDTLTSIQTPRYDIVEVVAERVGISPELFAAWRARNRQPLCLDPQRLRIDVPVVLVARDGDCHETAEEVRPTAEEAPVQWFSRVGFSPDGNQALVLEGLDCGDRCGEMGLKILVRRDGEWVHDSYHKLMQF